MTWSALDYSPALDRHDTKWKVGIITRADIVGRRLEVGGYLFAKDFPEVIRTIRGSSRKTQKGLGMSYEITEADIVNRDALIWVLRDFVFTGAAVLRRDRAAYRNTWINLD